MLDIIGDFLTDFLHVVLELLPTSPFQSFIQSARNIPYLQYLNWFIPIGTFISVGTAWLTAIALYYMYSVLLRWLRVIS